MTVLDQLIEELEKLRSNPDSLFRVSPQLQDRLELLLLLDRILTKNSLRLVKPDIVNE